MKTVGSRELKNRLGRYLKLVGQGETLAITDRGRVVARLVPVETSNRKPESTMDVLRRLEAEGHIRLATRPLRKFNPIKTKGKPASQMLLEDRE